jgi:hypothetical protein
MRFNNIDDSGLPSAILVFVCALVRKSSPQFFHELSRGSHPLRPSGFLSIIAVANPTLLNGCKGESNLPTASIRRA